MPKWNECSIYEQKCREGTCNHKKVSNPIPENLGQVAYEKYVHLYEKWMPNWEDLSQEAKNNWHELAKTVLLAASYGVSK